MYRNVTYIYVSYWDIKAGFPPYLATNYKFIYFVTVYYYCINDSLIWLASSMYTAVCYNDI